MVNENLSRYLWKGLDLKRYSVIKIIPQDETNPVITASAVNNYVRLRMMPAPERKRYSRKQS